MKWTVTFSQEQRNCCPPSKYQIVRTTVVDADTAEQAQQEVLKSWQYNRKITIKSVEEYKDGKQQGQ
jgi:hypothetical protein